MMKTMIMMVRKIMNLMMVLTLMVIDLGCIPIKGSMDSE